MSIYKKLLEMQKRVVGLGKDTKSFGYQYVSGGKVLENLKPIMNEVGLLLKQEIIDVQRERVDYRAKSGEKSEMLYSVKFKFTWVDTETGEIDENMFYASGMNDWEKGLGSALTYAERYFLLKYFHINTDEDDIDNPKRKQQDKGEPIRPFDREEVKNSIFELIGDDHDLLEQEMKLLGINSLNEADEEKILQLQENIVSKVDDNNRAKIIYRIKNKVSTKNHMDRLLNSFKAKKIEELTNEQLIEVKTKLKL